MSYPHSPQTFPHSIFLVFSMFLLVIIKFYQSFNLPFFDFSFRDKDLHKICSFLSFSVFLLLFSLSCHFCTHFFCRFQEKQVESLYIHFFLPTIFASSFFSQHESAISSHPDALCGSLKDAGHRAWAAFLPAGEATAPVPACFRNRRCQFASISESCTPFFRVLCYFSTKGRITHSARGRGR